MKKEKDWKIPFARPRITPALEAAGFTPLLTAVLALRGVEDGQQARQLIYGGADCVHDPMLMTGMAEARERILQAVDRDETVAVYGDYDVDGITSTCLVTDYLRSKGLNCIPYIPDRNEEGYGLNCAALESLKAQGVSLVVTVDCGITAVEETEHARALGIDMVITDHHECRHDALPRAVALIDCKQEGDRYPNKDLAGVGVALKLVCACEGDSKAMLDRYADLVAIGTVADVMPLLGENRVFVSRGLESLAHTRRPGIAALMAQSGCDPQSVSASSIGFVLAPRINAAGRMGKIELAVELFLTDDPLRAQELAKALCDLNRQRQSVESEIYRQAVSMLPPGQDCDAIVLADESWHQGVVGIVASRIAEEYACPAFLICLDGDHGKASSRSHGGFNLFASLRTLSPLLESYGGHELAAGFTISRENIPEFRRQISALAAGYYRDDIPRTSLDIDCDVAPELLTIRGVESLSILEPCGNGCPKSVLMMRNLIVERISQVGSGRHMRLRLRQGHWGLNAIYFSANAETASIAPGDLVDVAFTPQINDFRGEKTVQMNLVDIRPSCAAECQPEVSAYLALRDGRITPREASLLTPDRATLATVWRFLSSYGGVIRESPICLCRKLVRASGNPMTLGQLMTCLDIFQDVGLLSVHRMHKYISITLTPGEGKADLNGSQTLQHLLHAKES